MHVTVDSYAVLLRLFEAKFVDLGLRRRDIMHDIVSVSWCILKQTGIVTGRRFEHRSPSSR